MEHKNDFKRTLFRAWLDGLFISQPVHKSSWDSFSFSMKRDLIAHFLHYYEKEKQSGNLSVRIRRVFTTENC